MVDNRVIGLDFEGVSDEVEQILDSLGGLRADRILTRLLGRETIARLHDEELSAHRKLDESFRLVVAGDFKRGKSTFVNALLGAEVVPTAVTPETVTINEISYASEPRVEAVLKNRRRARLDPDELRRDSLEQVIGSLPGEIDHIEMGVPCELLRGLTIVDTPGLGDIMADFDERVAAYLAQADAIVFVVSALSPLSMDERDFLATAVLPQNFSRVLVALNMADAMTSTEDEERIVGLMRERTSVISDKLYVFPVSALDELCRLTGQGRPLPAREEELERDFARFRQALDDDVLFQKEVIKSERALQAASQLLERWEGSLTLSREAINQGVDELSQAHDQLLEQDAQLEEKLEQQKEQLARDVDAMRAEACGWMVDYLGRMRGELAGVAKSAKTREIQRHLQFYLTDKIREGIDACVKAHGRSIADLTATYSRDLVGEAMDLSLRGVELAIGSNLANVDWTGAVTVSYVGRLANEVLGGALTSLVMVGDVIAGVFRERQLSKRQADIIQPLLAEFSDVEESVLKVLETTYREMKNLACERLDDSYHAQLTQSAEALGNARAALEGEDVRAADLRERLDEVLEQVREYAARVAEML